MLFGVTPVNKNHKLEECLPKYFHIFFDIKKCPNILENFTIYF